MDCPSCMEQFDEKIHLPLNLECGHSYCQDCVSRMITEFNLKKCPECRDLITKPIKDLTPNLTILQIISEKKKFEKYKMVCETHENYFMDFQCKQCNMNICKLCLVAHSGHLVVPLNHSNSKLKKQIDELNQELESFQLQVDLRVMHNSKVLSRIINHQFIRQK